jgi:hypothetical protein
MGICHCKGLCVKSEEVDPNPDTPVHLSLKDKIDEVILQEIAIKEKFANTASTKHDSTPMTD